jgi:AcrR family transcriptional regulator
MTISATPAASARRDELLELAYHYVLEHGAAKVSLRPLATAVGSSPRVLLFLFGSKDGLLRALLAKARAEELELLDGLLAAGSGRGLAAITEALWGWLAAEKHRPLLKLWVEAYAQSLVDPDGPWAGFARQTVEDWLALLAEHQPPRARGSRRGVAERTRVLAVLRGSLLDLLATRQHERCNAAIKRELETLSS